MAGDRAALMLFTRLAREEALARADRQDDLSAALRAQLTRIAATVGPDIGRAPAHLPATVTP